jgi:hypothetical protein
MRASGGVARAGGAALFFLAEIAIVRARCVRVARRRLPRADGIGKVRFISVIRN